MTDGSRKAVVAAMIANGSIAVAKFVGFLLTRSAGLLAESVHSLADTGNQGLLLLGGSRAKRDATKQHPFGHGRERYFWAFAVALVLFSLGGMFALYEGIDKFLDPHEPENLSIAIGILVLGIALESYSLRTAVKEANHVRPDGVGWWQFIRTSKSPELPVVLLEDVGAEIGLFLALFGVIMAAVTDDGRWDAVGSISIGILLIVIAIVLIIEMKGLLIGEAAGEKDRAAIESAIEGGPSVDRLIHMRTQHIGPDEVLVGAKVEYSSSLTADELVTAINQTEDAIRAAAPTATVIYIEPDLLSGDHSDLPTSPDGSR